MTSALEDFNRALTEARLAGPEFFATPPPRNILLARAWFEVRVPQLIAAIDMSPYKKLAEDPRLGERVSDCHTLTPSKFNAIIAAALSSFIDQGLMEPETLRDIVARYCGIKFSDRAPWVTPSLMAADLAMDWCGQKPIAVRVSLVRAHEVGDEPTCRDCLDCGIGDDCYCATPRKEKP